MALPFPDISPNLVSLPAFHVGALTLGPFAIRWYALGYIIGILLGWRYVGGLIRNPKLWGARSPSLTAALLDDLILWLTLGIILGGRIGYILFYMLPLEGQRQMLAADPLEVIRVWHGGMSFHGGFLGVVIATLVFCWKHKLPIFAVGDLIAPGFPIGIILVRLANFINGELWGRVTQAPWGMVFCGRHLALNADGSCIAGDLPRHPSQLYEMALEGVVLFLILRLATHRCGWLQKNGAVTGLFIVCYGLFRLTLENFRMPDEGFRDLPLGLTMGMILSAPMILAGAWLVWRSLTQPQRIGPCAPV